jgi:hypothetical protein
MSAIDVREKQFMSCELRCYVSLAETNRYGVPSRRQILAFKFG